MRSPGRWLDVLVLGSALAAALAVAISAYRATGDGSALVQRQKEAPLRARDLERVLLTTPEPYLDHRRDAARARCRRSPNSGPWQCTVEYRSGRSARLRVTVKPSGEFRAVNASNGGLIVGCCAQPG